MGRRRELMTKNITISDHKPINVFVSCCRGKCKVGGLKYGKKLAYHNNSPVKKKNVVLYNIIYHKYKIMEILTFLNFMAKLSDIKHGIIKP